jgi:Cu2+-exporting ATPase
MASSALDAAIPAEPPERNAHGESDIDLIVPQMHCAGCLAKVERALKAMPGVGHARANLSTKRVRVSGRVSPQGVTQCLEKAGFEALPATQASEGDTIDQEAKSLLLALAVAGFGMMNVMLLSVSIWSGLASDMGEETRTLFHWLSALIAVPTVLFSGRPFFRSAAAALSRRTTNMDVPISLAVLLSVGASLLVTMRGGEHAYFDASVMLLFFLLCGRYLNKTLRARTFSAAQALLKLKVDEAHRILPSGEVSAIDIRAVTANMALRILPGERVPVDCVIQHGRSDLDISMVTGESAPISAEPGTALYGGTLNVTGAIDVKATAAADSSFLAEMIRIMESAEQSRAPLVNLADKVASAYAPVVHTLALGTFIGWQLLGAGWYPALMVAVAVLIITCPCALGLAVPAVQVTAVGKLLQRGIVLRSGNALDRLAQVDTVVFDKTGTLTTGQMQLINEVDIDPNTLALAGALAVHSRHPLAKSLARIGYAASKGLFVAVTEHPGDGIEAQHALTGKHLRLGRRDWAAPDARLPAHSHSELVFSDGVSEPISLQFTDTLRPGARALIADLEALGLRTQLLSGDKPGPVQAVAETLGLDTWQSECKPADKVAHLASLKEAGSKVVMIGDGLNDAPALRAAFVSMSPSSASDVAQVSADIVYQGEALQPVFEALTMARNADRKVKQNFALAIGYNALAIPLAVCGLVTPLIAALAMSASSLLVTGNAALLRLADKRSI